MKNNLLRLIEIASDILRIRIEVVHSSKLNNMKNNYRQDEQLETRKSVRNPPSIQITRVKKSLLSKKMNFSVNPKSTPTSDIVQSKQLIGLITQDHNLKKN